VTAIVLALSLGLASVFATAVLRPPVADSGETATVVDLNTAAVAELLVLPGIGGYRAAAIVARRRRLRFRRVADLLELPGVGPHLVLRLRSRLRVSSSGITMERLPE